MLAGHMAMHACQIGPADTTHPLAWDRLTGSVSEQEGNILRQATFLPPFLYPLLVCSDGATTLSLYRMLGLGVNGYC